MPLVLTSEAFQGDGLVTGVYWGRYGRLHWTVVDPNRHAMFIWRKHLASYARAATQLGASVFTNGPFTDYPHKTLARSTVRFLQNVASNGVVSMEEAKLEHFQARASVGHVVGTSQGIRETTISRPRLHYLGRREGRQFEHYEIAQGDPTELTEAIGGLFRAVRDYRPYTVRRWIRVGFWGLVPLVENPVLRSPGGPSGDGVIFLLAGSGNTLVLAEIMAAAGVKDAVQIDGNDSLLLGSGSTIRIGAHMPLWKQLLQVWGFHFQPITDPDSTAGD